MNKYSRAILFLSIALLGGAKATAQEVRTLFGHTPMTDVAYAKGVSGHAAQIVGADEGLLLLGGCNFPDMPALEGGAKRYYSSVYLGKITMQQDSTSLSWREVYQMPAPFAYAGSAEDQTNDYLYIAGGENARGKLSSVYRLRWNAKLDKLELDHLPDLPEGRSGHALVLLDDELFVVGGSIDSEPTSSLLSLNLREPHKGWKIERPYPGRPLLKVIAGGIAEANAQRGIYMIASVGGLDKGKRVYADHASLFFDIDSREWSTFPLPADLNTKETVFGGGVVTSALGGSLIFGGGVNQAVFIPALQRGLDLNKSIKAGKSSRVERLKAEQRDYFSRPSEWYRFNDQLWLFDAGSRGWVPLRSSSGFARADGVLLFSPWGLLHIGGEIKPGVRSTEIHTIGAELLGNNR